MVLSPRPGLLVRKAEVWSAPSALGIGLTWHSGGRPTGAQVRTGAAKSGYRRVKVSSKEQLVPGSPRCSCSFQMFQMKKHFPEKVSDVQFTEQTAPDYKHHLRSAWGPQALGAGGGVGYAPAE